MRARPKRCLGDVAAAHMNFNLPDRIQTQHHSDMTYSTATAAHPAERRSKKPKTSMLSENYRFVLV
jgi:hypothetical protein